MKLHRNSQKRYYDDYVYFITGITYDRFPYFQNDILCEIWVEEMNITKNEKQFDLIAWCLNFDHFHLMIKPNNEIANYSEIMQFFKRRCSRDINYVLGYVRNDVHQLNENDYLTEGDNGHCRLLQCDQIKMFDKKIEIIKNNFPQNDFPKFKWQKSFRDHFIRNDLDFNNHINYININHHKHQLPLNWKYKFVDENFSIH